VKRLNDQHLRLLTATAEVRFRLRELVKYHQPGPVPAACLTPLIDLLTHAVKARQIRESRKNSG
jgi:hypothetical protein